MTSEHEADVLAWRRNRLARLTGPDGWLTVVGLAWLEEGENQIGSAPQNAVRLPGGPDRIGTITVHHGRAVGGFDPESGVTLDGRPAGTVDLRDDAQGAPTELHVDSLTFYVIRRGGDRLAVRIKDAESPARTSFTGIDSYPIDARWRLDARFEPYDPPGLVRAPTIVGLDESYRVPGAVTFDHEGRSHRIDAFLEEGETDLFLVFGDLTNRAETYGGGRYLYTRPADAQGILVLDFNKAYNPPCVFTASATCVLPLQQNRLPIRIEAGEKLYRGPTVGAPVTPHG